MDALQLTRKLVDIESITGNEAAVGEFLVLELSRLGYQVERIATDEVARFNVFATLPEAPRPELVFSTHMDTVPPFFPSREDDEFIYGRGACDAKGIIAAQIAAAQRLRDEGLHAGLLFTVGEERDSMGAKAANAHARGSRFMINGEPTDNRLAVATKGVLPLDLVARGRMAHSAYPELGESAIENLLDALQRIRAIPMPRDPEAGSATLNIGMIEGGRAPNVIPDYAAARVLIRMVSDATDMRRAITEAAGDGVEITFLPDTPIVRLRTVPQIPTMIAAFGTDIPYLTNWGEALLFGPGSIHVAHTENERICKQELLDAVDIYVKIARALLI